MFDHSYCQNVHSQSQNRCFKEFANFRRKIPATKRPFAWGGGVETLFGRMPFEHALSLHGASLIQQHMSWQFTIHQPLWALILNSWVSLFFGNWIEMCHFNFLLLSSTSLMTDACLFHPSWMWGRACNHPSWWLQETKPSADHLPCWAPAPWQTAQSSGRGSWSGCCWKASLRFRFSVSSGKLLLLFSSMGITAFTEVV